jgi:DNA-directed RNA polymerase subunit F
MIRERRPLNMGEVQEYLGNDREIETELKGFIKKFIKFNVKEAKDFSEDLRKMGIMRVNEENASKIIDLLPEDDEDINKIFTDVGLDEDEKKKILETVKKHK